MWRSSNRTIDLYGSTMIEMEAVSATLKIQCAYLYAFRRSENLEICKSIKSIGVDYARFTLN